MSQRIWPAAIVFAIAASGPCAAAESPRAFVESLYAHYRASSFCPTCEGAAGRFFDAALVTLIRKDEKLAAGEVGSYDGDPICQCQDPDGMKAKILAVTPAGANAATARVELRFSSETTKVTFDLVLGKEGWRIHDIHTKDTPSFRKLLEDGTARMSK